jgi:hypothetical protein
MTTSGVIHDFYGKICSLGDRNELVQIAIGIGQIETDSG